LNNTYEILKKLDRSQLTAYGAPALLPPLLIPTFLYDEKKNIFLHIRVFIVFFKINIEVRIVMSERSEQSSYYQLYIVILDDIQTAVNL